MKLRSIECSMVIIISYPSLHESEMFPLPLNKQPLKGCVSQDCSHGFIFIFLSYFICGTFIFLSLGTFLSLCSVM